MSQAVPPVHSRRPRPEMNQNNANEPITAARFGETEWEARDVCTKIHIFINSVCGDKSTN